MSERKSYSFTLYKNNEKDKILINMLEMMPRNIRGKFIRGMLLKVLEIGVLNDTDFKAHDIKKTESKSENTEKTTKIEPKSDYDNKKKNPFEGLKL
ncbi:hypothetical protein [Deferribacter abyssi]|uniref:hypothetical protein n=1 Tax=Deferribacter abyssi TaxID=213806 RepID=UPI003C1BFDF4